MGKLIRVCSVCLRPVHVARFIVAIGAYCPKHDAIAYESTIKVPTERANYDPTT